jgi:dienelactone hydrolase
MRTPDPAALALLVSEQNRADDEAYCVSMRLSFSLLCAVIACAAPPRRVTPDRPRLTVSPESALVDQRVHVTVSGIAPGARVVIRARTALGTSTVLHSSAVFVADADGRVDLDRRAPVSGSYRGTDGMGLFWSMQLDTTASLRRGLGDGWAPPAPFAVALDLSADGAVLATATAVRRFMAPGVRMRAVSDSGVHAHFYLPHTTPGSRLPLVIVLTGSEGGYDDLRAAMLASHGYAALAVAYFGVPGTPAELFEIPVETIERAVQWATKQPDVDGSRIGVIGASKGAELALLSASLLPRIRAVVANAATDAVGQGIDRKGQSRATSSWTWRGAPLPFVRQVPPPEFTAQFSRHGPPYRLRILHEASRRDTVSLHAAQIAVERINGPILLISGEDDQFGPSVEQAESIVARLSKHSFPHPVRHLRYAAAGHQILLPYLPTPPRTNGQFWVTGGTVEGYARADADSWARTLEFFNAHLVGAR